MTKDEFEYIVNCLSGKDIETIKLGVYLIFDLQEFKDLNDQFEFKYKIPIAVTSEIQFYLLEIITKRKILNLLEVSKEESWITCSKFLKAWFENQFSYEKT